MQKNYIIDTNVMIHDPYFLYKFEDNHITIPLICIEELDKLKSSSGYKGYHAREALRVINKFRQGNNLESGVDLPGGGKLRVELNQLDFTDLPDAIDRTKNDNKILAMVWNMSRNPQYANMRTILVSKDLAMSIKADSLGITVQDYQNDKVDIQKLYDGSGMSICHSCRSRKFIKEDWSFRIFLKRHYAIITIFFTSETMKTKIIRFWRKSKEIKWYL